MDTPPPSNTTDPLKEFERSTDEAENKSWVANFLAIRGPSRPTVHLEEINDTLSQMA